MTSGIVAKRVSLRELTSPECFRRWQVAHYRYRHNDTYRNWSEQKCWIAAMFQVFEVALEIQEKTAERKSRSRQARLKSQREQADGDMAPTEGEVTRRRKAVRPDQVERGH